MTLKRKKAKPRARGTGCQFGRRCIAIGEYRGRRACAKHLADALFAEAVRAAGACWLQGSQPVACNGELQCAHVISRRYMAIRWSEDNARCLCQAHHLYYTHHPLEWEDTCRRYGIDWDNLRYLALNDPPMDPLEVIERLGAAA